MCNRVVFRLFIRSNSLTLLYHLQDQWERLDLLDLQGSLDSLEDLELWAGLAPLDHLEDQVKYDRIN